MPGSYELSAEMKQTVLADLAADCQQFMNLLQRGYNVPLEYKDIEMLRYISKQIDQKVRLLGGWTS